MWFNDKIDEHKNVYELWEKAWSRKNCSISKNDDDDDLGTNSVNVDCVIKMSIVNTVNIPIHAKKVINKICVTEKEYEKQHFKIN